MRKDMYYGAGPLLFEKAKKLRSNLTHAEVVLWGYLRTNPLGFKFRRQHPAGIYVVDFYCHAKKLVVEVDGNIHDKVDVKQHDKKRQKDLEEWGLNVIRFSNDDVELRLETVIEQIEKILSKQ